MSDRMPSEYLGDGVYVHLDESRSVVLRTGHHDGAQCKNEIYLEPEVMAKFHQFLAAAQLWISQHDGRGRPADVPPRGGPPRSSNRLWSGRRRT